MTLPPSKEAQVLLSYLVKRLEKAVPGDPRTYVGYKEVHDELKLPQLREKWGDSLALQGLVLADWTAATGKPGITGLIVDKTTFTPGKGYYKVYGRQVDDFLWWEEQIRQSEAFDWMPYIDRSGTPWTDEELKATVAAYLDLQDKQLKHLLDPSQPHPVKSTEYKNLGKKFKRSESAFELRMMNISYVLSLMGRTWMTGLLPAKNVAQNDISRIERFVLELTSSTEAPGAEEEFQLRKKRAQPQQTPQGSSNPSKNQRQVTVIERDKEVKAWVLNAAQGVCECCGKPSPFKNTDGQPFLEVHHVRKLAENGTDKICNAVAICPNCHRELHYGIEAPALVEKIYAQHTRLIRE